MRLFEHVLDCIFNCYNIFFVITDVGRGLILLSRDDSFASDFSFSSLNTIDLIAAIDKLCKLRATDTQVSHYKYMYLIELYQTYRALMNVLASTSIPLLRNASICALVEVVASNEDLKAIDNDRWRKDAVKVVAELIK